jgi:hypothetical protein
MELKGNTTVKELVDKHASMKEKTSEIFNALKQLKGNGSAYDDTELLDNAIKDKRYAVQLLLQEYNRIIADMKDLEAMPIKILHD